MGVFGFVAAGGGTIGVLLGGVLTDVLDWHWIFLVNVPIAGGLAFAAVGLGLLARAPVGGHYVLDILPSMLLLGRRRCSIRATATPSPWWGATTSRS